MNERDLKKHAQETNGVAESAKRGALILVIAILAIFVVIVFTQPHNGSGSAAPVKTQVVNSEYAKASDVEKAEEFLRQLPSACSNSRASALLDGTINIRLICEGNRETLDGFVQIKDGVVTDTR